MTIPNPLLIEDFKKTPGAISVCEAIAIYNIASEAPAGNYMELGSHAGKAAMMAGSALPKGVFYMVDPCYDLTNLEAWRHSVQGHPKNMGWDYFNTPNFSDGIVKNVSCNGVLAVLCGDYSLNAIPKHASYSYIFVDSDDHQEELVMSEVKLLEDRMVEGGIIAFHDFRNQYHGPAIAHSYLIGTGKYENVPIDWDAIRKYVSDNNLESGNSSWHMPGEPLPCFVGAVKRKPI